MQESLYNYTLNPSSITQSVCLDNYKVDFTIRERVNQFLESEDVFTADDWEEYRGYCAYLVTIAAKTIGRFSSSAQRKKELYNKITETPLYKRYLQGERIRCSTKTRFLFRLIEHKAYWFFDTYWIIRRKISKIRNH